MKSYELTYNTEGTQKTWGGFYSRIDIVDNTINPELKDIKVYEFDEDKDDEEYLSLSLFACDIVSIDYDYIDDEEDDNTSFGFIDIISFCIGLAVGMFLCR